MASTKFLSSEEQRLMYASEKLQNFRWISKLVASYSPCVLTHADLAPSKLVLQLDQLGQLAELAYSRVPIDFLIKNYDTLSQSGFPLDNSPVVENLVLVSSFNGYSSKLPGYIAYRPQTEQLIVAISGTASLRQAVYDVRAVKRSHPSKEGSVHSGFWLLYQDIKSSLLEGIRQGLSEHKVTKQLVLTGHSMGGSLAYLLCIDLLTESQILPSSMALKIAVFGAPRTGDQRLVDFWTTITASYRQLHGEQSLQEHSVKAFNDGVPALPPMMLGYRHFASEPLYTTGGQLYIVPPLQSEYSLFHVEAKDPDKYPPQYPLGGHNYYNNRDQETILRRLICLDKAKRNCSGWEDRYLKLVSGHS